MRNLDSIIIFAFRYALKRETGAPLMVCNFIRSNIKELEKEDIDQIIRDIEYHGVMHPEMSDDFNDLSDWLKKGKS